MDSPPAWSAPFMTEPVTRFDPITPLDDITPDWAWGGRTGKGVKVAVIDSGIDAAHPAVRGVDGYVAILPGRDNLIYNTESHADAYGHGTACAGIIRAHAPDCQLYSVKVLGPTLGGQGAIFAAGLRWAIDNGMDVCNLSLGTTKKELFGVFHELVDRAYFRNIMVVTAANNLPELTFPSVYASVISVASHAERDACTFYYNTRPPVEFGAMGVDARVAWREGTWITATGNSFAAAQMSGIVARILDSRPGLPVFQMKGILRALAANKSDNHVRRTVDSQPATDRGPDM